MMIRFMKNYTEVLYSQRYLEPVDGAAADKRRKHAETVAERVADWTHRQHDVQVTTNALREEVVHRQRRSVNLPSLQHKRYLINRLPS